MEEGAEKATPADGLLPGVRLFGTIFCTFERSMITLSEGAGKRIACI